MSFAVSLFFQNGGSEAWIARLADDAVLPGDRLQRDGIYVLDHVPLCGMLCLPGVSDPVLLNAAAAYCEERRALLLIDSPRQAVRPEDMATAMAGAAVPKSGHAAVYYPWIAIASGARAPCSAPTRWLPSGSPCRCGDSRCSSSNRS